MGREPIEEHIPLTPADLSYEAQQALAIFSVLPDKIEGFNGLWLGKEYTGIGDIFEFYGVDNKREVFELLAFIVEKYRDHLEKTRPRR